MELEDKDDHGSADTAAIQKTVLDTQEAELSEGEYKVLSEENSCKG